MFGSTIQLIQKWNYKKGPTSLPTYLNFVAIEGEIM